MKQPYAAWVCSGICAATLLFSSLLVAVPTAYGETYVAGQFGLALPGLGGSLSGVDITSSLFIPGTKHSDLELSKSFMYGGKLGHYFNGVRWFGLEAEVFYTTPHIEQQDHTFSHPTVPCPGCTATFQGAHFRVLTVAPFNLMFRYHKTRLQPYLGVGPGIFFARIKGEGLAPDSPESTSDNARLGLNAKVGLEYHVTRHLTAFAEWKFNYARFNFNENQNLWPFFYSFDATYTMHLVSFGVGYHF